MKVLLLFSGIAAFLFGFFLAHYVGILTEAWFAIMFFWSINIYLAMRMGGELKIR